MTDSEIIMAGAEYTRPKTAYLRIWKECNNQQETNGNIHPNIAIEKVFHGMPPEAMATIIDRIANLLPNLTVEGHSNSRTFVSEACISAWLQLLYQFNVVDLHPVTGWTLDEDKAFGLLRTLADLELQDLVASTRKGE